LKYSKAISFSTGLNESGANFTLTCEFINCDMRAKEICSGALKQLYKYVDHKHFNFDYVDLKQNHLQLSEVLEFLLQFVRKSLNEAKETKVQLSSAELDRGGFVKVKWVAET
jgi:hypothetical protein